MLLGRCVAFRTRNAFVVCALRALLFIKAKVSLVICALYAVLLEWGIIFLGAFYVVLLEQGILLLFVHFMQYFWNEEYSRYLCTLCGTFSSARTFLFVHFAQWFYGEKISLMTFMDRQHSITTCFVSMVSVVIECLNWRIGEKLLVSLVRGTRSTLDDSYWSIVLDILVCITLFYISV